EPVRERARGRRIDMRRRAGIHDDYRAFLLRISIIGEPVLVAVLDLTERDRPTLPVARGQDELVVAIERRCRVAVAREVLYLDGRGSRRSLVEPLLRRVVERLEQRLLDVLAIRVGPRAVDVDERLESPQE